MRIAGKPVKRSRRLNLLAVGLISAAVLFAIYCGLQASFGGFGSKDPGKGSTRLLLKNGEGGSGAQNATSPAGSSSTGGVLPGQQQQQQAAVLPPVIKPSTHVSVRNSRKYHTITTTQGFANHWQARIHYYWFKKQKETCEALGEVFCDIGGFTRLLHSGHADDLMDEIPTVVVDKLPDAMLKSSSYVVLNRPYAFLQWLDRVSIPERYIMMAEADHLFIRPMPNLMPGERSGAALFSYIVPSEYKNIVRKFVGQVSDEEIGQIPKIGNSPTFISVQDFRKVAPLWCVLVAALGGWGLKDWVMWGLGFRGGGLRGLVVGGLTTPPPAPPACMEKGAEFCTTKKCGRCAWLAVYQGERGLRVKGSGLCDAHSKPK